MEKKIVFLVIAGLWVYIVLRSISVPITIDESATFFHYIQPQEWIPGDAHWDANNHILNSGLSILSYRIFGPAPWALRLPNVLAGLFYLIFSWLLAQRITDRTYRWALFIALAFCSFLLEFFGLCRGYGLSMAFFLMAIWSYNSWLKTRNTLLLVACLLSTLLMVLANMSLLISALILSFVLAFQLLAAKNRSAFQLILTSITSACGLYFAIQHSFDLKDRGLLYYGEGNSFWDVTVSSLAEFSFYPLDQWLVYMFPAVLFVILIQVLLMMRNGIGPFLKHRAALPVALLIGNLTAHISMKHLLGVNYPEDRVALMYLPLLAISTFYAEKSYRAIAIIPLCYTIVFPLQLLGNINVDHSVLWNKDHALQPFYQLALSTKQETGATPTTEGYRLRNITFDHHNHQHNAQLSSMRAYSENGYLADLIITENGRNQNLSDYQLLLHDPLSNLSTYRRIRGWHRTLVAEGTFNTDGSTEAQFKELVNIPLPADRPAGYLLVPDLCLISDKAPARISVVGQISNADHASIDNHEVALDRLKLFWNNDQCHLDHAILLDTRYAEARYLKVFLWNRQNQGSYTATGNWTLYELR